MEQKEFEDVLYTVPEVAQLLKTDEATVRRLISKKILVGLKLGRIKVTRKELMRFLDWASGKDFTDLDNIKEF
ncbi:DNA binding domain-containing protein, excisionase family [Hathewaya proteolytica DSM 3090]|uniref:DNA binding domain-containing protein, excisionase family n=1 Tax=Hathewaya proteolytica DSM 3090 TaxID=1121331 RepID=A0A1M6NUZ9_9CLOT|nr:helix-turn-helix domain-containing protein [Hathewaya proteolytica]SHJ99510.1 DNA binding domain-containing protein, excisionase family [Hathewaya proteolytica DSM 3090]